MVFRKREENVKPILSSKVYFWSIIFVLSLLFVTGMVTAYKNATARDPNALPGRIVALGDRGSAAGNVDPAEAYAAADERFRAGDEPARVEALTVMMALDPVRAEGAMSRALSDASPRVRQAALELAGVSAVSLGAGTVVSFLSDADAGVRAAAAGYLTSRPYDPSLMYPLSTPLGSGDLPVVTVALQVWTQFAAQDPAVAAQALAGALTVTNPEIVTAAVNAVNAVPANAREPFRAHLQGVSARLAGTPAGDQAASLVVQIP